ncbi:jg4271, partial [Pararge aegeria aegeria]
MCLCYLQDALATKETAPAAVPPPAVPPPAVPPPAVTPPAVTQQAVPQPAATPSEPVVINLVLRL